MSSRYVGPFEIVEHVGPMVYYIALIPEYTTLHDVFYASMLKKYHYDPSHVISCPKSPIPIDMAYVEFSTEIINWMEKVLCKKRIPVVKLLWQYQTLEEAMWEIEEKMSDKFLELF